MPEDADTHGFVQQGLLKGIGQWFRRRRYRRAFDTPAYYRLFTLILALYGTLLLGFIAVYWLFAVEHITIQQALRLQTFNLRIFLLLLLAGLWLDLRLLRSWRLSRRFEQLAQQVQGKVIERWRRAIRNEEGYLYRFYLAVQVGERAAIHQEVDRLTYKTLNEGDPVDVLHLPGDPRLARLGGD